MPVHGHVNARGYRRTVVGICLPVVGWNLPPTLCRYGTKQRLDVGSDVGRRPHRPTTDAVWARSRVGSGRRRGSLDALVHRPGPERLVRADAIDVAVTEVGANRGGPGILHRGARGA